MEGLVEAQSGGPVTARTAQLNAQLQRTTAQSRPCASCKGVIPYAKPRTTV